MMTDKLRWVSEEQVMTCSKVLSQNCLGEAKKKQLNTLVE
jgi:hypothetical protein